MNHPNTASAPGAHELGDTPPEIMARVTALLRERGIAGACSALGKNRMTVLRIAAGQRSKRFVVADVCERLAQLDALKSA